MPLIGQAVEQEVEIDETGIRAPGGQVAAHLLIVRRLGQLKPGLEVAADPGVIPGEYGPAAQAPEQHIFPRTSALRP